MPPERRRIVLDRDSRLGVYSPVCIHCRHLSTAALARTCSTFPGGIPAAIWDGQNDHRQPYPGDRWVHFEPALPGR